MAWFKELHPLNQNASAVFSTFWQCEKAVSGCNYSSILVSTFADTSKKDNKFALLKLLMRWLGNRTTVFEFSPLRVDQNWMPLIMSTHEHRTTSKILSCYMLSDIFGDFQEFMCYYWMFCSTIQSLILEALYSTFGFSLRIYLWFIYFHITNVEDNSKKIPLFIIQIKVVSHCFVTPIANFSRT